MAGEHSEGGVTSGSADANGPDSQQKQLICFGGTAKSDQVLQLIQERCDICGNLKPVHAQLQSWALPVF